MKKFLSTVLILLLLPAFSSQADAKPTRRGPLRVKVVSQNVYVGANVFRLVAGDDPKAVLETVQQTNFPERSVQMAKQLRRTKPDVVGLQEVADITISDGQGNQLLRLDYLEILLQSLRSMGLDYEVGASINNLDGTLPIGADQSARVVDRDVILYRSKTTSISDPVSKNYATKAQISIGGAQLDYLRGYTAVTAEVKGERFRFVNTHFETQNAQCETSAGPVVCQEAQAKELVEAVVGDDQPTVLVGDLNAEVGEPTYQILADAGYLNTRDLGPSRSKGFTCCNTETLDNDDRQLDQRIDHILVRAPGARKVRAYTRVLGNRQRDRTPSGLWPSDHAAPYAKIKIKFPRR